MKKVLSLVHLICSCTFIVQAQTLSGVVTDSVTGKPVAGASVFISNSSRGTATTTEGNFNLPVFSQGRYDLVVSSIGYTTEVLHLRADSLPDALHIQLRQKMAELDAFTVEANIKTGWREWGGLFMDNFIGTSDNADECKLENRKVLRFFYSKKHRFLSVTAREPLIILNKALGYELHYQLERFIYDDQTNIVQFTGYPLFEEMKPESYQQQQEWMAARKKAYLGSLHHFLQCIYAGITESQGFRMMQLTSVANKEKQRVQGIYDPNAPIGTYPSDSLHYYWRVMKQPGSAIEHISVTADSLTRDATGNVKVLTFTGPLYVAYLEKEKDKQPLYNSTLIETYRIPVDVDKWGNYVPAGAMLAEGHWSYSEHICNMVPLDYPMPPRE